MRNRDQINPAFFQKQTDISAFNNLQQTKNSIKTKLKQARRQGTLNLSSIQPPLTAIPPEILALDSNLEEDEKFWEIEPLKILDLSFNAITFIPSNLECFADIHTIKLRSNKVTALPAHLFATCRLLRVLDCSDNQLTEIADNISELTELRELYVNNNRLTSFPASLLACRHLVILHAQHNHLSSLPVLTFPALLTLDLSQNQLASFPPPTHLPLLEDLSLSNNRLAALPSLRSTGRLKHLDVSYNALTAIESTPTSLVRLIAGFNRIHTFPTCLLPVLTPTPSSATSTSYLPPSAPSPLAELLLPNNQLSSLPSSIESLQNLKFLDVGNNQLTDLPPSLGYITPLQAIVCIGNPIKQIRQAVLQKPAPELKAYLRTRGPSVFGEGGLAVGKGVGGTGTRASVGSSHSVSALSVLSEEMVYRLRNVSSQTLDFSRLDLSSLTHAICAEIMQVHSNNPVGVLLLAHNQLASPPYTLVEEMGLLTLDLSHNLLGNQRAVRLDGVGDFVVRPLQGGLTSLNLSHNKLTCSDLPHVLPPCATLRTLVLAHNPLTLPAPSASATMLLPHLPRLTHLDLSYCQLNCLPAQPLPPLLTHLDLSNNRLTNIPTTIMHPSTTPSSLSLLSIENNEISEVPAGLLLAHPQLSCLLIAGNPQRMIRGNVVAQGGGAVVRWLQGRLPQSDGLNNHNQSTHSSTMANAPNPPLVRNARDQPLPPRDTGMSSDRNMYNDSRSSGMAEIRSLQAEMDRRCAVSSTNRAGSGRGGSRSDALARVNMKKKDGIF